MMWKITLSVLTLLLMTCPPQAFAKITDLKESYTEKLHHTAPKREILTLAPSCNQGAPELLLSRPGMGRCHLKTQQSATHSASSLGLKAGNRNSQAAHREGRFSSRQRGPALIQDPN
ncbi:hypothetical protein FAI41_03175 [Acetobacteraceae bacterium]|nr:hypothetical protein FAI41_03175 [Acetobacteraceae bacterium]